MDARKILTDPHDTGIAPQCWSCAHLLELREDGWHCDAYSSTRIPKDIMVNLVDHREPQEGDSGITWAAREDLAKADMVPELVRSIAASGSRIDGNDLVRAAGVIFLTQEEPRRILLVRRAATGSYDHDHPGEWSIPAGRIEDGETAAEAAVREVVEETGRAVAVGDLMEWTRSLLNGVDFTTFVASVSEAFVPNLNDELDSHDWVDLEDLKRNA